MTRDQALPIARKIAAAVCVLDGCGDDFCEYMRNGSYDDSREVQAAVAALTLRQERRDEATNVVEIAA